jgi:3-oxoacyl-[acyl-carrier-protein] synthase-3
MPNMKITGAGMYVPERVVTNDDLAILMDTSDAWIVRRTGVRQRRYCPEGLSGADMAEKAFVGALAQAQIEKSAIEAIISATLSPDHLSPGMASFIQDKLGLNGCAVLDIRNQCTGFLYSLAVADAWIKTGLYRTILLTGTEIHSTALDYSTRGREVTVLFGDGAGVMIAEATDEPGRGVLALDLHGDGKYADALWIEASGHRFHPRVTHKMIEEPRFYPQMHGRLVYLHAVRRMPETMQTCCAKAGVNVADVDFWILHQANLRINEFVCESLGIPPEKSWNNIDKYGNTTAATLPLVLCEAQQKKLIEPGMLVGFAAFGAGFTWGALLMRW